MRALPVLLEGRLTCLDRTQTENTQMYFFFFLSRFRRIHVNWIKLCSLCFWNSIYSDRVAFFICNHDSLWSVFRVLATRLDQTLNSWFYKPSTFHHQLSFFPKVRMTFSFFFFDLPWKRRSRFCVLVLLGFDLGVVDPLAGCALEILPVCLHLVLQQHVNPATSSKEKRLELSKFHIYFM